MREENPKKLIFGLPKGSMEAPTLRLFAKAGWKITTGSRSYRPRFDDPQLEGRFLRAQELSRYVEEGFFDAGITGKDWILENGSDVEDICSLEYSKASNVRARHVLAVPEGSPIRTVKDLEGKRIATELVNLTRRYLEENEVKARVEFSWGATEVKVPELVDAIVDITETGSSLQANNLRIIDTLLFTEAHLIANRKSWEDPQKRKKIENMALLLRAALEAENKVGLKLNAPREKVEALLQELPALRNPTISPLSSPDWVAIETVIDESEAREILPRLKAQGAEGIIEYSLNKLVY